MIVSWQQSALATLSGSLISPRMPSPASLLTADIPPGPQTYTLDAARLAALPDGTYAFVLRAQTAVGEQVLRASFKLDRRAPTARLVRFRLRGRSAFLVVRLSEATTVRIIAGARVVVPRRPRGAGLNGFRFRLPAGVPTRLRLQLIDTAGNAGRAGPFVSRRKRELIVSSGTISRIGARRASSARLASSSSPGRSLAPFTINPRTARLRRRAASSVRAA